MRSGIFRDICFAAMVVGAMAVGSTIATAQTTQPNPTPPTQPPTTLPADGRATSTPGNVPVNPQGGAPSGTPMNGVTTAPASAPVVAVDLNSPRGTLKVLLAAIQTGDPEGIKKVIHATNPTETKMVDAMAHRVSAENNFRQAAIKAFGADAAKQLVGDPESNEANMAQIDAANETVQGDSAVVDTGRTEPTKLTKVDGQWRLPASELAKDLDPAKIQQSIDDNNVAASLIDQFATEVGSGKYKTAAEAGESIQLQMRAAVVQRSNTGAGGGGAGGGGAGSGATTTPAPAATNPSGGPG